VADLVRNARPIWIGTGGRFGPESPESRALLSQIDHVRQTEILQETATRNAGFFDTEMEKLERNELFFIRWKVI